MKALSLLFLATLAQSGDEVVARVDDVAITGSLLARRAAVMSAGQQQRVRAEQVLEGLIGEALLAKEARNTGLDRSPFVARFVALETRRAAAGAFSDALAAGARPDDETLRAMFHATADLVRFESLVFEHGPEAEAALERIRKGASFASEASSAVVARTYANADAAPQNMRAELPPALATALVAAAPGQVAGPIDLGTGWTIARLLSKEIGTDQGFIARRESLLRYAKQQSAAKARQHFIEQRKSNAAISVDDAFLASIGAGDPTPAQLAHPVATVNGRRVEYRDVRAAMQSIAAGFGHASGDALRRRVLQQEIEATLLADTAVERGYLKDPAVVALAPAIERGALAAAYADQLRAATPAPGEDEIAEHYRRNPVRFERPFAEVLPAVVAGAAAEKRELAVARRVKELRGKASVSIDRPALARAAAQR